MTSIHGIKRAYSPSAPSFMHLDTHHHHPFGREAAGGSAASSSAKRYRQGSSADAVLSNTSSISESSTTTMAQQANMDKERHMILDMMLVGDRGTVGTRSHRTRDYTRLPGPARGRLERYHLASVSTARVHDGGSTAIGSASKPVPQYFMNEQPYWLYQKSDGNRRLLYVTHSDVWLVNEAFEFESMKLSWESLCTLVPGTLLDGEFMNDATHPTQMRYVITDAIMVMHISVRHEHHSKRIAAMAKVMEQVVLPTRGIEGGSVSSPLEPAIMYKKFVKLRDVSGMGFFVLIAYLFSKLKETYGNRYIYEGGYEWGRNYNRGIVFVPETDAYLCEQHPLLEWTWPHMHRIHLKLISPYFDIHGRLVMYARSSTRLGDVDTKDTTGYGDEAADAKDVVVRRSRLARTEQEKIRGHAMYGAAHGTSVIVECTFDKLMGQWSIRGVAADVRTAASVDDVVQSLEGQASTIDKEDLHKAFPPLDKRIGKAVIAVAMSSNPAKSTTVNHGHGGSPDLVTLSPETLTGMHSLSSLPSPSLII